MQLAGAEKADAEDETRDLAVKDAIRKAKEMAHSADLTFKKIVSIVDGYAQSESSFREGTIYSSPKSMGAGAGQDSYSTDPGHLSFKSTCTLVAEAD